MTSIDRRIHNELIKFIPEQKLWEFLNVGCAGVGSAFFAAILFTYNWNLNPLLWRVFSPKSVTIGPGDHHTLIMITFGVIFASMLVLKIRPVYAVLGMLLYVYGYESLWYVTYIITRNLTGGPFEWPWVLIALNCLPGLVGYAFIFRNIPWKFFAAGSVVFVVWAAIGFPITNDFVGQTQYFFSLPVNAWEILTHILVAIPFFAFVYPVLKKVSEKMTMRWWNID